MKKILLNIAEFISVIDTKTWLRINILTYIICGAFYNATLNKLSFIPFGVTMVCLMISVLVDTVYLCMPAYFDWVDSKQTK